MVTRRYLMSWARIGGVHRVALPSGARGTGDTFRAALKAALSEVTS